MQMHHIHIRLTLRKKMCRLKRRSKNRKRRERDARKRLSKWCHDSLDSSYNQNMPCFWYLLLTQTLLICYFPLKCVTLVS